MTTKRKKVRCLVCNEIIVYKNDDTSVLIDHLNSEHTGQDVFRFLAHCQTSNSKINSQSCSKDDNSYEGKENIQSNNVKATNLGETQPNNSNRVRCPKCGAEGEPLVKKQKSRLTRKPLGALCLLGCWPLCYLPFLFNRQEQQLCIYCSKCSHYLGIYDRGKCCSSQSAAC